MRGVIYARDRRESLVPLIVIHAADEIDDGYASRGEANPRCQSLIDIQRARHRFSTVRDSANMTVVPSRRKASMTSSMEPDNNVGVARFSIFATSAARSDDDDASSKCMDAMFSSRSAVATSDPNLSPSAPVEQMNTARLCDPSAFPLSGVAGVWLSVSRSTPLGENSKVVSPQLLWMRRRKYRGLRSSACQSWTESPRCAPPRARPSRRRGALSPSRRHRGSTARARGSDRRSRS